MATQPLREQPIEKETPTTIEQPTRIVRTVDRRIFARRSLGSEDETRRAYQMLRFGFTALPIITGLDKFMGILTDWTQYLSPSIPGMFGISGTGFMAIVGIIEVVAGIGVAVKPKIFGNVVGIWLLGIVVNLLILGRFYDVALRDFGLSLGAFALALMATKFDRPSVPRVYTVDANG